MNLETIVQALQLSVKSGRDRLGVEVRGGYASLKDLAGIILVRGAEPAADTLEKAVRENIPLFMADLPAFEMAGRIYQMICPRKA
jgi:hypothetical protein